MNLTIDIGNSLAKLTLLEDGQVVDFMKTEELTPDYLKGVLDSNPEIRAAILVSVREEHQPLEELLRSRLKHYLRFDSSVPVPIQNRYTSPTLGPDRLAAAVGADTLYPNHNVLVVDFGTAITIDLVSAQGEYLGGNISPGVMTRFRALHHFTRKLPLLEPIDEVPLLANDSHRSIQAGVMNGIVFEIEGYIRELEQQYDGLRIIFTGGDGNLFAKRVKNPIFATYDLVAYGLNRILEYNADEK